MSVTLSTTTSVILAASMSIMSSTGWPGVYKSHIMVRSYTMLKQKNLAHFMKTYWGQPKLVNPPTPWRREIWETKSSFYRVLTEYFRQKGSNCDPPRFFKIHIFSRIFSASVPRGGVKKNWEKVVSLTAWVDPPPSSGQENVKTFWLSTLDSHYIRLETNFTPKKYFLTTEPLRSISRHSMIFTALAVLGQLKRQ